MNVKCFVFVGVFVLLFTVISMPMYTFGSSMDYYPEGQIKGSGFYSDNLHDQFAGPREGEQAPNFKLTTLDGRIVKLSDYLGKKPLVIEFGSYTCPIFRQKHKFMEQLYKKYSEQANFLVIYTIEAHPQADPSPYSGKEWVTYPNKASGILYKQPTNWQQRKDIAKKARLALNIQMTIAIDDIDNAAWKAYGQAPNAAYLIGSEGRVKLRQGWFEPSQFEQALIAELK
jgi:cytochrome oxidase Cu insertion factor (SCO1/SenC/PrrC family)